jgi:hypothetical protein
LLRRQFHIHGSSPDEYVLLFRLFGSVPDQNATDNSLWASAPRRSMACSPLCLFCTNLT